MFLDPSEGVRVRRMFSPTSRSMTFSRSSILVGAPLVASSPDASTVPSEDSTVTSSIVMPGTAAATRWRIAPATWLSSRVEARIITEAEGGWRALRNEPSSGSTTWTRAARMPEMVWIVRASSPSSARTRVTSCMKEVRPSEPILS